tara:strand:- start:3109 stop:3288 length:180 start_codon:yes stop_codon:yes gene_type:complete
MPNIELSNEELQILYNVLNSVQVSGLQDMQKVLTLAARIQQVNQTSPNGITEPEKVEAE